MRPSELPVARRVPWGSILSVVALVTLAVIVVISLASNATMQWDMVGKFLFNGSILDGVRITIELTLLSVLFAGVLGFVLALAWRSQNLVVRSLVWIYIWIFRGTPLLVQLLFWFNIALVLPEIHIPIPFMEPLIWDTNDLISGYTAALLGLIFHEAAYMAEIFRGGFLAVSHGQVEAALSLGMTRSAALRRIVLPQSLRAIIPPTVNQIISLLKMTSLVAVIGGGDLLTRAQFIYGSNFAVIPLLIVVTIWYLVLVTVLSALQWVVERHLSQSSGKRVAEVYG